MYSCTQALKRSQAQATDKDAVDALAAASREHSSALSVASRDIALISASLEDMQTYACTHRAVPIATGVF